MISLQTEYSDRINDVKHLITGVKESWLMPELRDAEVSLNGYQIFGCVVGCVEA